MALSDITNKILEDAKKEADKIKSDALDESSKIASQATKDVESAKKETEDKTNRKSEAMLRKTETLADTEHNNLVLQKKRAILKKVFDKAKKAFASLPEAETHKILVVAFANIPDKKGIIHAAKGKESEIKKAMKDAGQDFDMGHDQDLLGGFVFVGKNSEIDFSFESIIENEIRPSLELEIAKDLFS